MQTLCNNTFFFTSPIEPEAKRPKTYPKSVPNVCGIGKCCQSKFQSSSENVEQMEAEKRGKAINGKKALAAGYVHMHASTSKFCVPMKQKGKKTTTEKKKLNANA